MLFWSDKPEKNGPRIEAKLRKELGATAPLAYATEIEGDSFRAGSLREALGDAFAEIGADPKVRPMYTFRFDVAQPRPCQVHVSIVNRGGTVIVGTMVYAAPVAATLAGKVTLGDRKLLRAPRFAGDEAACARLNADGALLRKMGRFVSAKYKVGEDELEAPRWLELEPQAGGAARLTAATLPRSGWFGLASTLGARDFLEIAARAEAALRG